MDGRGGAFLHTPVCIPCKSRTLTLRIQDVFRSDQDHRPGTKKDPDLLRSLIPNSHSFQRASLFFVGLGAECAHQRRITCRVQAKEAAAAETPAQSQAAAGPRIADPIADGHRSRARAETAPASLLNGRIWATRRWIGIRNSGAREHRVDERSIQRWSGGWGGTQTQRPTRSARTLRGDSTAGIRADRERRSRKTPPA